MTKLSIIVPVYNVENYIRPCFESIFKQGLDDCDFEVVIVNDGTTDRSLEMISDLIEEHNNITIIHQKNQGLSIARNNGVKASKGEYIFMPDPDDLLIENSLKPILEKALESHADIIMADFITMTNEEIEESNIIQQKDIKITEKTGEQIFMEDLSPYECFVWRSLFRRAYLIEANLRFFPGIRFQDIPFTHECYIKANKCLRAFWLLNIYRKWGGAATGSFSLEKAKDNCKAITLTWNLTKYNFKPKVINKIKDNMWISFSVMIRRICKEIPLKKRDFIDYLSNEGIVLNFKNGIKQRLVTFLFKRTPYFFINICIIYYNHLERLFNHHNNNLKHKKQHENFIYYTDSRN